MSILVRRGLLGDCLRRQLLLDRSELLVLVSHLFILAAQLVHLILQVPLHLGWNERLAAFLAAFAGPRHQLIYASKLGTHLLDFCLEQILLRLQGGVLPFILVDLVDLVGGVFVEVAAVHLLC